MDDPIVVPADRLWRLIVTMATAHGATVLFAFSRLSIDASNAIVTTAARFGLFVAIGLACSVAGLAFIGHSETLSRDSWRYWISLISALLSGIALVVIIGAAIVVMVRLN